MFTSTSSHGSFKFSSPYLVAFFNRWCITIEYVPFFISSFSQQWGTLSHFYLVISAVLSSCQKKWKALTVIACNPFSERSSITHKSRIEEKNQCSKMRGKCLFYGTMRPMCGTIIVNRVIEVMNKVRIFCHIIMKLMYINFDSHPWKQVCYWWDFTHKQNALMWL